MSELLPILDALLTEAGAGRPAALCAVVKTIGSTPQVPGAALLVRSDFSTVGTLGGGCVEAEVRQQAFQILQRGESGVLDFNLDHDYGWDDGLMCGGGMSMAIMPITAGTDVTPFRTARDLARHHAPASVPLIVLHEGRPQQYLLHLEAPPTLMIAGGGHVGQAVARYAATLDFHVTVIDDRADVATPARFPPEVELVVGDIAARLREMPLDAGSYVVIVTRGHRHDRQALEAVLNRPAVYLGMIGSRRKSGIMLKALAESGVSQEELARVHTPIGLPIGALTVNEIAVSILAEIIQVRRQTTPRLVEGPFEIPV